MSVQSEFRKLRKKKWFLPSVIGVGAAFLVVIIALLLVTMQNSGGLFAKKSTSSEKYVTGVNSVKKTEQENTAGNVGTLYSLDDSERSESVGYTEVLESGYDTEGKSTGTSSRLQEIQEQLDELEKKSTSNDTSNIQKDMRGKVDYDTLNKSITDATSSIDKTLSQYEATSSSEHSALRNVIASNKSDSDSKIKSLENALNSNSSADASLATTVKDNYSTTQKQIKDLQNSAGTNTKAIEKSVTDLEASTTSKINSVKDATTAAQNAADAAKTAADAAKNAAATNAESLSNLEGTMQTTINNVTNIVNGQTAVLIGSFSEDGTTFTIKGGN